MKIRAIMRERGVKPVDIARQLDVKLPSVSQTLHSVIVSNRIRTAISNAVDIPVEVLWPDSKQTTPSPDPQGVPVGADAPIVSGDGGLLQGNLKG